MKGEKVDRRVKYTRMVLKDSLIALLKNKPIEKISVKQICDMADINRSTFYAHYKDQYDLMNHIEQEVLNELNDYLNNFNLKENEAAAFESIENIFKYIVENEELSKVLLGENGRISFQKEIMTILQRQCMSEWKDRDEQTGELIEYFLLFGLNGSIGVVQKWLRSGMKFTPGEMAQLIIKLTYNGVSAFAEKAKEMADKKQDE